MLITQSQVLEWLPPWIAAEFDCPRGPHEWVEVSSTGRTWAFCKHCTKKRRTIEWPDTLYPRHAVAVG